MAVQRSESPGVAMKKALINSNSALAGEPIFDSERRILSVQVLAPALHKEGISVSHKTLGVIVLKRSPGPGAITVCYRCFALTILAAAMLSCRISDAAEYQYSVPVQQKIRVDDG